ncbi:MAG: hypothetical protein HeimC3_30680 [Candidatus Heimdallarchaeota archaeon LC_3]|nr:MAG: hypothetical protein HeimC3_30680 [Candidatus Heimdallarchaeota archaeon LC_3]
MDQDPELNKCKFCKFSFFINIYIWKCKRFNISIKINDIKPCFELDNRNYHIEYIQATIK